MTFLTKKLAAALLAASLSTALHAAVVNEVEANDTLATAQNIDGAFSLDFSANIGDAAVNTSTTIPHVTIRGTGNSTYDVYRFTTPGGRAIFDIDFGRGVAGGLSDPYLRLLSAAGTSLAANDDATASLGQGGSIHSYDSYIETTLAAGTYYIRVGRCCESPDVNGTYELQVSVQDHAVMAAVPEPGTLALLSLGLGAVPLVRRRLQQGQDC